MLRYYISFSTWTGTIPWIWTSVCVNLAATLVLAFNPGKNNPKVLLPTWVELSVTLGILALGITVVTWLIRAALIIEERYEH